MQIKIYEHEDAIFDKDKNVEEEGKDYREALRELDRKKLGSVLNLEVITRHVWAIAVQISKKLNGGG